MDINKCVCRVSWDRGFFRLTCGRPVAAWGNGDLLTAAQVTANRGVGLCAVCKTCAGAKDFVRQYHDSQTRLARLRAELDAACSILFNLE